MPNQFSKSINARLEAEARRKTAQEGEKIIPEEKAVSDDTPVTPVTSVISAPPPVVPKISGERETADPFALSTVIKASPKRAAANKTFYLDGQVIRAIKENARRQNVPESKLVNDILRYVLHLDDKASS